MTTDPIELLRALAAGTDRLRNLMLTEQEVAALAARAERDPHVRVQLELMLLGQLETLLEIGQPLPEGGEDMLKELRARYNRPIRDILGL
jgi:hypothetical protein